MAIIGNYFERSVTADKRVDSSAFAVFRTKQFGFASSDFSSSFNQSLIKINKKKLDPLLDLKRMN